MAAEGAVYQCREPFLVKVDGADRVIAPRTTIREGHPILAAYPQFFEPLVVDYEWSEPEEPEPPAPKTPRTTKAAAGAAGEK